MTMTKQRAVTLALGAAGLAAVGVWALGGSLSEPASAAQTAPPAAAAPAANRPAAPASIRLNGLVEAVDFYSVVTPRVTGTGQGSPQLTIVRMAPKGTLIKKGDVLVEFDRQGQLRTAMDKRAEWLDLEEQIKKKKADQNSLRAQDETALKTAENAVALGKLEVLKNPLLPTIEAEKNSLTLEGAEAKFVQLKEAFDLKQKAAAADLRILEVRRDRASNAMKHAERNAEKMVIRAPIDGLVVLKPVWRQGTMGEPQEGEEMWPGSQVMDLVGPSQMRVRVRVNQADFEGLKIGQTAKVTLDAYPGKSYPARLEQLSPIATASSFSPKVRNFVALFDIDGSDRQLTPDLSAAVDVDLR